MGLEVETLSRGRERESREMVRQGRNGNEKDKEEKKVGSTE